MTAMTSMMSTRLPGQAPGPKPGGGVDGALGPILVVDSSPITRKIIRAELTGEGYTVLEAGGGQEALRQFAARRPALVTLAVEMAEMNGFEVCERLRALEVTAYGSAQVASHVPVLFITGSDTVGGRERGFAAGAADFLVKPFVRGGLSKVVNAILRPPPVWLGVQALVADDSPIVRRMVVRALHQLGVDVLQAADGRQALELAKAHAGRIEMIISDLMMPGMDGDELCRRVRREKGLEDVPFIVLSAAADRENVLALFKAGATDYVSKPFSLEELLARVQVHLDACLLNRDLTRRNRQMEDDLGLAREVQSASLRDRASVPYVRKAVRYLPQSVVSGDVYNFAVSSAGALNVFVGDATGHGVGAALMTMMVQTGLDSIGADAPVNETLTRLHALVHERTGDQFITGLYARIDPDGQVQHASAGHPPMILLRQNGAAQEVESDPGLPLGMLDPALPFPVHQFRMAAGDRLFLFSDGVTEWAREDGSQFDTERLKALIASLRDKDLDACVDGVLEGVRTFSRGRPSADDVTLVALEYQ